MKKYIPFVVVFALLLLMPFTVQFIADLRGEKSFVSLDIFKDVVYTPFKREFQLNKKAETLNDAWKNAREDMAQGASVDEVMEPVVAALSELQAEAYTVNAYATLDSVNQEPLKNADSWVTAFENDSLLFKQADSSLKTVIHEYSKFSLKRIVSGIVNQGVLSGAYLRAFEDKVEKDNALVLALRPKYQYALWKIFNEPGEKVVMGTSINEEDPWLFYRQDVDFLVEPNPLNQKDLDNPIESILYFKNQLKEKAIELLVVIVPGKPSIYPERLGTNLNNFGHGKKILDSLNAMGIATVDLYTPLWQAKSKDSALGYLYLNDDTHWTPRGAELAAEVIAKKVKAMENDGVVSFTHEELNPQFVVKDSLVDRMGDIGEMSGLNQFNVFKPQQVTSHVVSVCTKKELEGDTLCSPYKDDFRKAKILILGDSFSRIYQTDAPVNGGWIAHFSKDINEPVASIVSDGGASTLVREKLARKSGVLKGKKLVIWEFVERDLRFGAEGWKNLNF